MSNFEVQYQVKDGRGFPGDLKQAVVEATGQQTEWLQVAVAQHERVSPRSIHVIKSRSVK